MSVSRGTAPSTWKTKTPHDYDHDYDDHYDHYPGQGDQLGQDLMVQLLAVQQPRPGASRANLIGKGTLQFIIFFWPLIASIYILKLKLVSSLVLFLVLYGQIKPQHDLSACVQHTPFLDYDIKYTYSPISFLGIPIFVSNSGKKAKQYNIQYYKHKLVSSTDSFKSKYYDQRFLDL